MIQVKFKAFDVDLSIPEYNIIVDDIIKYGFRRKNTGGFNEFFIDEHELALLYLKHPGLNKAITTQEIKE